MRWAQSKVTGHTATARVTRRRSPNSSPAALASPSTASRSFTATPTRCRWAGHLWLALGRGRHVGDFKALDKIEAKAKRSPVTSSKPRKDIEFKDGKFTVKGTDKSIDWVSVALNAYTAHKFNGQELEPGLKERVLGSAELHLPGRRPHLRTRDRSADRRGDHRTLDRGRRLRQTYQSDDRRGPDAWRRRPRHRPGADGRRAL